MKILLMAVFLVVGFVLLVKGADLFVDGACAISRKLRIPAYIIGLTVVAFGTSLPEAAVSVTASLQHSNEIAIGNVVGSNIFNTLVVLGASALLAPVAVKKNILKRDFPFCIFITALMLVLILTLGKSGAELNRLDGVILLVIFAAFMTFSIVSAKKSSAETPEKEAEDEKISMLKAVIFVLIGVAGVIAGGELTVKGAREIALMAGLSERVVGLTVVAIGTSLPELVTSVIAAKKQESDIAVGNVIGSNIFNILFILGVSACIDTLITDMDVIIDISVLAAIMAVTYVFAVTKKQLLRPHGIIMILMYAAYTGYLLMR